MFSRAIQISNDINYRVLTTFFSNQYIDRRNQAAIFMGASSPGKTCRIGEAHQEWSSRLASSLF
jgi:hypothetical protein